MMGSNVEHWPEALASAAWLGFIDWAYRSAEVRARFHAETGHSLDARRTGIEAFVEWATGYRDSVLEQFVEWATVEIWGLEYAPAEFREAMAAKAKTAAAEHQRTT